jgi:aspartate-semialdehyde dehydrogenase
MHVAILGATGLVGREILKTLEERKFPLDSLSLLASERSAGQFIDFKDEPKIVEMTTSESFDGVDLVLASAGGSVSKEWLPMAVSSGGICIDNTSAFRMDPEVPLVVPEINSADLKDHKGIIANPNCSTIQMVMALEPLHQEAGLKRVVVSTYQSVSGKGKSAVDELEQETVHLLNTSSYERTVFPHQIAFNCLPDIDDPTEDGYTKEEQKMMEETRKIMGLPDLAITATCVRVPVFFSHAEAVFAEFERPIDVARAREVLSAFPGVRVVDQLEDHVYPIQSMAADRDDVYVGRIRPDRSVPNGLALWVVSDNIRKGAALNTVQIAEQLLQDGLIKA